MTRQIRSTPLLMRRRSRLRAPSSRGRGVVQCSRSCSRARLAARGASFAPTLMVSSACPIENHMRNKKYLPSADPSRPNDRFLFLMAAVVAIGVFVVDALTPLDVAIAVLYVIVVLLVAHTGARRATIATSGACIFFTLLGFVLSHEGDYNANAAARCAVSLLAIVSTAYLVIRNQTHTRRQQAELRATIDAIPGMVWSSAGDGRTAFVNRRWNEMGVSLGEGETDRWQSIVHPEDRPLMEQAWREAIASGSSFENESRVRRTDGTYRWMHIGAAPVRDESGQVLRWYGVNTDIDARKQAEDALRRSTNELAHVSRMTALGELAASIAHEVTQPIAAIMTCGDAALRWLKRPQPDIEEASQSLVQVVRDAKRAADVIRQIRSMAQRREPSRAVLSVNDLVHESIELVRQELKERRVEVRCDFAASLPAIQGDRVQIQQVLINLMMNAVQAMSEAVGGKQALWVSTAMFDDRHAHVRVRDSGPGISEDNKSQIFNAFFTTKADGVGMGLSICRSIVEAHGGRIWIESPPDGGAIVQFILPVCGEGAEVSQGGLHPDVHEAGGQSAV